MTAYVPETGHKVTSTLLVGEWEVDRPYGRSHVDLRQPASNACATVGIDTLTRVPPQIPEPPIGALVFVDGAAWLRNTVGYWYPITDGPWHVWSDIADKATPAVPLADVVAWLDDELDMGDYQCERLIEKFGWPT